MVAVRAIGLWADRWLVGLRQVGRQGVACGGLVVLCMLSGLETEAHLLSPAAVSAVCCVVPAGFCTYLLGCGNLSAPCSYNLLHHQQQQQHGTATIS